MNNRLPLIVLTGLALSAPPFIPASPAMTGAELLDTMRDAYEEQHESIEDYTLVTDMYTTYYRKKIVDGRTTFETRTEVHGPREWKEAGDAVHVGHSDLFDPEIYDELRRAARYGGTETRNGDSMPVLEIDEMRLPSEPDTDGQRLQNVRMLIEPGKWVAREMSFDVDVDVRPGQTGAFSPEFHFDDYRNVEGMWIPYRTTLIIEIGDDLIGPEEREQARQQLAQMERQLEQMPEEQRAMMEQMMGGRIDQIRGMLEGERMEWVINVREVKVNTGLSDDLFE